MGDLFFVGVCGNRTQSYVTALIRFCGTCSPLVQLYLFKYSLHGDGWLYGRLERISTTAFILALRAILGLSVTSATGELDPATDAEGGGVHGRIGAEQERCLPVLIFACRSKRGLSFTSAAGNLPPTTTADGGAKGEGVHVRVRIGPEAVRLLEGYSTGSEGLRLAGSVNAEGVRVSAGKSPVGSDWREPGIACGALASLMSANGASSLGGVHGRVGLGPDTARLLKGNGMDRVLLMAGLGTTEGAAAILGKSPVGSGWR